ncbi:hypothetical protein FRB98_003643 [Tulasnella sp. 332]|nr:hypothetical protein FRB98_003643 [Tulasnella sp. 332]
MNRLFLLTTITAFYVQQRLVFPTPTATAYTIQSLHATATPSERRTAEKKIKVIGTSFVFSLGFKTVASYFPGVLWDWHIFWWLSRMGLKSAIAIDSWGWWLEFTPAFISAGALSGLNASWSFLAGAILAWGMIGPLTVNQGVTFGEEIDAGKFPGWMNYMSMTSSDPIHRPSPRYWMLWPGVTVMLVYSFTEVAWSAPMLFPSIKTRISALLGRPLYVHATSPHDREDEAEEDPASPEDQIPTWQWTFGLLLSSLGTLVVGKYAFDMDYLVGVVALLLAFVFSFVGVQASGTTDVNPVGTIAKASQLVIGGITKRQGLELYKAQTTNLIAGSIAGQAASHAVDMVGDLKTGHILGASPRSQFYAQLAGSFLGIWLSVVLFVLFASAYPCITDLGIPCTAFGMPAVQAWRSVTEAVTRPELPIPPSSAKTAVVLGIISGITVPVRQLLVPQRHRGWVPNWSAFGLGFVVPQTYYPIAMVIGAHIAHYWEGRYPAGWEIWGYSLSAGLIAGEGIGGVVTALMVILGLDGGVYGSAIGCPGLQYCG